MRQIGEGYKNMEQEIDLNLHMYTHTYVVYM